MNEMNVLFYLNGNERLYWLLHMVCLKARTRVFHRIKDLARRLRQPKYNVTFIVLVADTGDDLLEMLSIRRLLSDVPVILILPDRREETIATGHKLYPRFLTYVDGDLEEVGAVFERMLENYG